MSLYKSAVLAGTILITGCGTNYGGENLACASGLQPIEVYAPNLPPQLHNEFEGFAKVNFRITSSGQVSDPIIKTEEWTPIGNARGQAIGYKEAILDAATKLVYEAPASSCMSSYEFSIHWES